MRWYDKGFGFPPSMDSSQVKPRRPKIPRWLLMVLMYAISIGSLAWALRGYDFAQIKPAILSVKWGWVLLAVVFDLTVYIFHGWRWNILLSPVERLGLWRTVQSIYIGLFANEVLPLRPGEIIRCYLLAFWSKIPLSLTLTSMAIERVLDGIWLILVFIVASKLMVMPRPLVDFAQALGIGVAAATVIFLYVLFHKQHAHSMMSSHPWTQKFIHVLDEIHHMGNWRTLAGAFGVTCLYWLLQVLSVWALFKSYEMDLAAWHAAIVLVIIRLGTIIPNAPGNLGVFNSVAKLALMLLGVEAGTAFELSVVMWVALTFPLLIGGFVALFVTGLSIGEIHRHARTQHHAHRHLGRHHETPASRQ